MYGFFTSGVIYFTHIYLRGVVNGLYLLAGDGAHFVGPQEKGGLLTAKKVQ